MPLCLFLLILTSLTIMFFSATRVPLRNWLTVPAHVMLRDTDGTRSQGVTGGPMSPVPAGRSEHVWHPTSLPGSLAVFLSEGLSGFLFAI